MAVHMTVPSSITSNPYGLLNLGGGSLNTVPGISKIQA